MISPTNLLTFSLLKHPQREGIVRVLSSALAAVDPAAAVRRWLENQPSLPFPPDSSVHTLAIGKAAYPMTQAALAWLEGRSGSAFVITKDGHAPAAALPSPARLFFAGHPLPDERGEAAADELIAHLCALPAGEPVLCLLSGGASALMPAPVAPLTLGDLQELTALLLASGASIGEINTLRKHLDQLKGGGLARLLPGRPLLTLVLSDVLGNPLDIIASGPTVPDPGTFQDCLTILETYDLITKTPPPILAHLRQGAAGAIPETPKPGDALFTGMRTAVIASLDTALQAALEQAGEEGWTTDLLTNRLAGEARDAATWLADQAALANPKRNRPLLLLAGGETTVTLRGDGKGGRNQEIALAAVEPLALIPGSLLVTLASDGGDGPTDAAGAVVTSASLARAKTLGLDPAWFLARNDSYTFFAALGDLIRCGPTQTNVNDLAMILLPPSA